MKTYLTLDKQLRVETDPAIIATLERKGWVPAPQPAYDPATQQCEWVDGAWVVTAIPTPTYTAESWLDHEGYGAMRLLGLLDLESKFGQQSPPKMQAVRAWINSIRAQYAETKSDWQSAPHTFESTMQEIAQ